MKHRTRLKAFFKEKRDRVFYRYLISYFTILFGAVLMGVVLYSYCFDLYSGQVEQNAQSKLEQLAFVLDSELEKVDETAQQIFASPDLTPFNLAESPVSGMYIQRELKKYSIFNLLIDDVYFYPGKGDYLISATSSLSVERFYQQHGLDAAADVLYVEKGPLLMSVQRHNMNLVEDRILIIYSDWRYNQETRRTLIFTIYKDDIWKLLNTNRQADAMSVIIYNAAGEPLLSSFGNEQSDQILAACGESAENVIQVDGQAYYCIRRASKNISVTYLLLVDRHSAFASVYRIRSIMLLCLAGIVVLGVAVSFLWAMRNYGPLAELDHLVKTASSVEEEGETVYDSLRYAFETLQFRNVKLEKELTSSAAAVREHLLYSLLRGQIPSLKEFKEKAGVTDVKLPWENYTVAIFRGAIASMEAAPDLALYRVQAERALPADVLGYAREHNTPGAMVMLLCMEREDTDVCQALSVCRQLMAEKTGVSVSVGIGGLYHALTDFPRAYIEALDALDYRFLKGENSVLLASQFQQLQKRLPAEMRHVSDQLARLLRQGDPFAIKGYFVEVINTLRDSGVTVSVAKMVCYDILNTVYKHLENQYHDAKTIAVESPNVFIISSFDTLDDLLRILLQASNALVSHLERASGGEEMSLSEKMVEYIKEHCGDCDFSVGRMAEEFSMSASNLSQYFKGRQGETVMDFMTQTKFGKAKELLLNTKMPLQDIAIEVGYYNVTSFIRRFKQQCGQTPGDFRKSLQTER